MSRRQRIPEGLAEVPPGPELARLLAGVEPSRLCGFDAVELLRARYRQLNHDRARLMATMVEVGLAEPGPDDELPRREVPDEFAADEIRAALVFTRRAAEAHFALAYDLCSRLPAVHAAMDAGWCDEPRARVLSEWTQDLSEAQARAVCARLLPRVGELTTGQLIEAIKKLAIAVDPDWARRRYERAVAERKVVGRRNPDGSADLAGLNLPVDRVAAAAARIDALAKAAKRAGVDRPIDHLRAELFLGMTDGAYTGLDDSAILASLLPTDVDHAADAPVDGESDGGGASAGGGEPARDDTDGEDAAAADRTSGHLSKARRDGEPTSAPGRVAGGIELRVRLTTLLGRDQHPAEIAGWGPVHAGLARDLIPALLRAEWRFVVTDTAGHPRHVGITRARPAGPAAAGRTGDVVELQAPAALLESLSHDSTGPWAPVVADLARQHTRDEILAQAGVDPYAADADRRHPGAAQRRHLQVRDRRCIGPGCRVPARHTDQDHTRAHSHGGTTLIGNRGGACRHDHRLKTDGGWTLTQPEPGHFTWTSRLGRTYHIHPQPIIEPLPDPTPDDHDDPPRGNRLDDGWEHDHILDHPPPQPPLAAPRYDLDTDPPPF